MGCAVWWVEEMRSGVSQRGGRCSLLVAESRRLSVYRHVFARGVAQCTSTCGSCEVCTRRVHLGSLGRAARWGRSSKCSGKSGRRISSAALSTYSQCENDFFILHYFRHRSSSTSSVDRDLHVRRSRSGGTPKRSCCLDIHVRVMPHRCLFVALSGAAMGMVVGAASGVGRAYLFGSGRAIVWPVVQQQSLQGAAFMSVVLGIGGGIKCLGART